MCYYNLPPSVCQEGDRGFSAGGASYYAGEVSAAFRLKPPILFIRSEAVPWWSFYAFLLRGSLFRRQKKAGNSIKITCLLWESPRKRYKTTDGPPKRVRQNILTNGKWLFHYRNPIPIVFLPSYFIMPSWPLSPCSNSLSHPF